MHFRTLISSLSFPSHEENRFDLPHTLAMICCHTTVPKQWSNHSWNKTSNPVSQNKFSLFISQWAQAFCYSNRKQQLCEKEGMKNTMHLLWMLKEGTAMSQ
jgi:hypothetical protein